MAKHAITVAKVAPSLSPSREVRSVKNENPTLPES